MNSLSNMSKVNMTGNITSAAPLGVASERTIKLTKNNNVAKTESVNVSATSAKNDLAYSSIRCKISGTDRVY